jgi:hypothetical protein
VICRRTADRLKTRCAGLLELGPITEEGYSSQHDIYLHRTVQDFLERSHIWPIIVGFVSDAEFHPAISMLQSCIRTLRCQVPNNNFAPPKITWRTIQVAMIYAGMADAYSGNRVENILDELDLIMSTQQKKYDITMLHWSTERALQGCNPNYETGCSFLSFPIEYGVSSYVRAKLYQDPMVFNRKLGRPLLDYAVCPSRSILNVPNPPQIVAFLLDYGASPNEGFRDTTP